MEDRDKDKVHRIVPQQGSGQTHRAVSVDVLKSAFIAEGLSAQDISDRFFLSVSQVEKLIEEHNLPELRREYMKKGLEKIRDSQIGQAQKLLDLELDFKKMRLIQLENQLRDFMAYYGRHGDFYKRHPSSGEILHDTDGIPMQVYIPSVAKEIHALKESVTVSEGITKLLSQIDDIINGKKKQAEVSDAGTIDMDEVDGLFKKKR